MSDVSWSPHWQNEITRHSEEPISTILRLDDLMLTIGTNSFSPSLVENSLSP
jgi:hypothetical protein